jgi:hypothetical protein
MRPDVGVLDPGVPLVGYGRERPMQLATRGRSEPQGRRPEWFKTILSASWRSFTGSPMPTGGTDPLVWHSGHLTS